MKHFLQKRGLQYASAIFLSQVIVASAIVPSIAGVPTKTTFSVYNNRISTPVKGVVTDSKGMPLPGVSITEKGTTNGTSTDADGNFKLNVANNQSVLTFSYIGYTSKEVTVGNNQNLFIKLDEDVKTLEQVVVVGYGTQRKKDLTGAVGSISGKDIASQPVPDIGQAIQGRAAGVQVVSTGAPGSNVTLRIRGVGTINNSDPLLVIDGVPSDVPLNTISPDDIASMDILKDASASAIYGSRGANGVVLITTKRGVEGKGSLEFKVFTGVQDATSTIDMLNASQFASLSNEMLANNNQPQNPAFANPPELGTGTNWLNELFRSAPMQNYSLAYSAGTEKSHFYLSGSYLNQNGIVINNYYKRYTIQFNSDSKVFDWLKFANNITLNHDVKSSGSYDIRNAMAALPTQSVFNTDGTYAGPVGQALWYGDIANPVGKATINNNATNGYNILGNINAEATIIPELKFKTTLGAQAVFYDSKNWAPKYNWQPIPQPESYLAESYNKSLTWMWDNYLTYDKFLTDKHHLTVLGGISAQTNRYDNMNGSVQGFVSDATQQLENGTMLPSIGGTANEWSLLSFIGRANYAYDDKYLVTATLRRDGSSRFGSNNRWGWFPSGSVAWRISQEDFFGNPSWINDLKIRAGYGITGNQNIGNYSFASVYQTGQYAFNGTAVGSVIPLRIPNPSVKWEQVEQANLGVDASLLNNRITVSIDGYIKNTNDMLVPMSVPISTGYSDIDVPSINAGNVRNKGVEFTVAADISKGDFNWNAGMNVSYNVNEVLSLNGDVPLYGGSVVNQNVNIQKNGLPVNAFYGFLTNGLFQTQTEVDNYAVQTPGNDVYNRTSAGDVRFLDINNDGRIDDADRTFLGNPNPRFIFAMNNTLSYKGVDLAIFLQGVEGNQIFNANRIFQEGMAVAQNQTTAVLDRWHGEGTSNTMPRAVFNDPNKNTRPSNRFIEDGSYLRVKNVTLGYTLPQSLMQKIKLQKVRIYLSAQNLFTFTNYSGFDPEVSANGIDFNVYPVTKTISAGINLNF
ncbi:TonB dependent receptor [compost metagenome]